MKDECCNFKVTELDDGYRLEITGNEVKNKCKSIMEKCCTDGKSWMGFFKDCCPSRS